MKDQDIIENNQNILSIEEYRKKQIASRKTATGDVLQTPSQKEDKKAPILVFKQKQQSPLKQTGHRGGAENIVYMKNYLKSVRVSGNAFKEETSPLQTFKEGNIVMMNEYIKRKTPEHIESSDWTNNILPPHGSFQKWTAAVAVAVLVMVALPFFTQEKREVAGEKKDPVSEGFFKEDQGIRRGPQSVPGGASLSVNQIPSGMISAGRKPTKEEQLNGY